MFASTLAFALPKKKITKFRKNSASATDLIINNLKNIFFKISKSVAKHFKTTYSLFNCLSQNSENIQELLIFYTASAERVTPLPTINYFTAVRDAEGRLGTQAATYPQGKQIAPMNKPAIKKFNYQKKREISHCDKENDTPNPGAIRRTTVDEYRHQLEPLRRALESM